MNKKVLLGIIVVLLIGFVVIGGYYLLDNSNDSNNSNNSDNSSNDVTTDEELDIENDNLTTVDGNILVVYFSAQGHMEDVANTIANNLGADIFEIEPTNPYTSDDLDWTDDSSRVTREHEDESLRNIELTTTTPSNWDNYDTVLIGYPIWWGIAAWPTSSFVQANDFSGKTVIPFCTSSSSGLGQSGELLAEEAGTGNWQEGYRFSSNPSDDEIKAWTDSLSS